MFHRGDYKSLHVGQSIPDWWHSPVQVCQANQYYMTSELLSCQLELDFVTEEKFQEIAYMEEFGSFLLSMVL